jgi:hypothetical protein
MSLEILDKIVTLGGLFEIRSVNELKGYNYFTGNIEKIEDFILITEGEFLVLKKLGKDKALQKIKEEYPELKI